MRECGKREPRPQWRGVSALPAPKECQVILNATPPESTQTCHASVNTATPAYLSKSWKGISTRLSPSKQLCQRRHLNHFDDWVAAHRCTSGTSRATHLQVKPPRLRRLVSWPSFHKAIQPERQWSAHQALPFAMLITCSPVTPRTCMQLTQRIQLVLAPRRTVHERDLPC